MTIKSSNFVYVWAISSVSLGMTNDPKKGMVRVMTDKKVQMDKK